MDTVPTRGEFIAMRKEINARFKASRREVKMARRLMEKRLEDARTTHDIIHAAQDERTRMLELSNANMQGRMYAVGVIITIALAVLEIGLRYLPR